ncbi:MAG TPA: glycosyltransferase family 39 protein [Polyangiaceae bacterium]
MSKQRTSALFFGVAVVASLALAHGPLLGYRTYANVDEAYASALASRLLDGFKLYDGAISQRGPLMYESFAVFARVFGWDDIRALRVLALGLALLQVALVYVAGRKLLSRSAALVAAAVTTYALAFGFPALDGVAINGETLQAPLVVGATLWGALAVRRSPASKARLQLLLASGFTWGAAIAVKPQVLPQIVPLVLWLVLDARRRKTPTSTVLRELALTAAGLVALPLVFVAHAAENGTLGALVYYAYTYNVAIHLGGSGVPWLSLVFTRLHEEPLFFVSTALLVASAFPFLARRARALVASRSLWALGRGFGTREYLGLHFAIAFAVAVSMQRFFPHYWLVAMPSFAWLVGAACAPLFTAERTRRVARAMLVAVLLFTVLASALECVEREKLDGRVAHDRTVQLVSRYVDATTPKDARIFVWGFSSWIYGYSQRKPAGRYVFSTYVTGFVPWFWDSLDHERARIVPGSTEALIADLEAEKPEVIVDAGSVMMARPMRAYEKPAALLRSEYCFEARVGAYDVYRRRHAAACPTESFPAPHWTVDAWGHPLPIPLAPVVDAATTKPLPPAAYDALVTFADVPISREGLAAIARRTDDPLHAEEIDPTDPLPASHPERTPPLAPSE